MSSITTDRLYGASSGVAVKAPVVAVSTGNLASLSGLQTVGGVVLNEGDRVLVKSQTNPINNGIYSASASAWQRTGDFDGPYDVVNGTLITCPLANGNGALYQTNGANPILPGTTPMTFTLRDNPNVTYPQTQGEINAAVVPFNTSYLPGNMLRYGADTVFGMNSDIPIANALAAAVAALGVGFILHPGGTINHLNTVAVPDKITICGNDRNACVYKYNGGASAWRYQKSPALTTSGYAMVNFFGLKITSASATPNGAPIELNASGWSYFEIRDCWLAGTFKYGLILDAVELCTVHHNIIDVSGAANAISLWIINGAERNPGQLTGFTNILTINDNQISGNGGQGIVDDGGDVHYVTGNNVSGHSTPAQFASVNSLTLNGNSFETPLTTGSTNVLFTNLGLSGAVKGPNTNGTVNGNTFAGNMVVGASNCVAFSGASYHTGFGLRSNVFLSLFGRGGAIDVTKLANSTCEDNVDQGSPGMFHYVGVHHDEYGNKLGLPQAGAAVITGLPAVTFGDQRYPLRVNSCIAQKRVAVQWTPTTGIAGLSFNSAAGNHFLIPATSNAAFTINNPLNLVPAYNPWTQATAWAAGNIVLNWSNGNAYICTVGGVSAGAGTGPTGTVVGAAIVDGTVTWNFLMSAVNGVQDGQEIDITIRNTSGVALGAITWGTNFRQAAGAPATGNSRTTKFRWTSDVGLWIQSSGFATDIPN